MMRWLQRLLCLITGLGILLSLVFTAIELVAFDKRRYDAAYARENTAAYIGISPEDLDEVTGRLLDYLSLRSDSLDMEKVIRGQKQQVFGERETLHMVDVRNLFAAGYTLRLAAVLVAAAGVAALIAWRRHQALALLAKGYLWAVGLFALFAAVVGIAVAVDFRGTFILFHQLLFTNDLWLLDPATDVLIQMFPEQFFNDMARAILVWASCAVVIPALAGAAYLIDRRRRKRTHELRSAEPGEGTATDP